LHVVCTPLVIHIGSVVRDKWKRGAPESEYHEERRSVRRGDEGDAGEWELVLAGTAADAVAARRIGGRRLKAEGCRGRRNERRGNEWHACEGKRLT
jgi:hypothetical protein